MNGNAVKNSIKYLAFALALITGLFACGCKKSGPSAPYEVDIPDPGAAVTAAPTAEPTAVPTEEAHETPSPTEAEPTEPAQIPPIQSVSGEFHTYSGVNVMRVDDRAYEICVYLEDEAQTYAKLIGDAAEALKGITKVYDLIIPTAYGVMMPDDMRQKISYYVDLGACIEKTYSYVPDTVTTVSSYDRLMHHRDEFIYFRTDHHWTARGAYYAYTCFCDAKGIAPYPLEAHEERAFEGFLGTLYKDSGKDPELLPEETVTAYEPVCEGVTMTVHYMDGTTARWPIVTDVTKYSAIAKYNTFAGADNPLTVFENPNVTDGSVLIIVKESFGNAMMAFLADHYSKIYEIDYRYYKGNVIELAKEVGATDLLFANNFMMISSRSNIGKLSMIIK